MRPVPVRDVKDCRSKSTKFRSSLSGDQDNPHVPLHSRMRAFDRDLIRGGHYGQRSCEPHKQAEHMAAPTKPAGVKKVLANSEPSTHGTSRRMSDAPEMSGMWA